MNRSLMVMVLAVIGSWAPPQNVEVRILEPQNGSYVTGDLVIRAALEPRSAEIKQMTFFADMRLVCRIEHPPFECPWNAGNDLREHTFRVVATLADKSKSRLSADVRTKGADVDQSVDVDRVHVVVSVLDGSRFVRGLPHAAFRVFEDEVRQKTTFFQAQDSTLEVVVGLDVSSSMTEALEGLKENAKRFLSALRPADRVTVGAFNENYFLLAPPNVDLPTRLKKIDYLAPWGMTSLYEVVLRSFDQLGRQAGRRALVIFTDGEDTSSRVPREAVEKRAERNEAQIYVIGQGKVLQSGDLRNLCERIAEKSGGLAFFPRDAQGVTAAFDAIVEELSNQYLLSYEPPSSTRDGRYHRIRVEVDGGYDVRAPKGYTLKLR